MVNKKIQFIKYFSLQSNLSKNIICLNWKNFLLSVFEIKKMNFFSTNFYNKKKNENFYNKKKNENFGPNKSQEHSQKFTLLKKLKVKKKFISDPNFWFIKKSFFMNQNFIINNKKNYLLSNIPLTTKNLKIFLQKLFLHFSTSYRIFWYHLLITISDIKMRSMLEHYDYFGLYATARNFITVHSELNINKSMTNISALPTKKKKINFFFRKFFKFFKKNLKNFNKKKLIFLKKIRNFKFLNKNQLEWNLFLKFYLPFCTKKFEKTDVIQWLFFLEKYLIYRKLLPFSTRDFFGYMSKITKAEKFLYSYPYHLSSLFFKNFVNFFSKKKKRFFSLKFLKNKIFFKNFIFAYANMTMHKLPTNWFTKRTDSHFIYPFKYVKLLLNNIFENKKYWNQNNNNFLKSFKKFSGLARLVFSLNWSSGKRYVRKCLEHETYVNLDYFKKAKYVRKDLVTESFSSKIWKDFSAYAEKFNYNTLNFNYKKLLWNLFPHFKLIEYNLIWSNNINTFLSFSKPTRKFFSLMKIFWNVFNNKNKQHLIKKIKINFDFFKMDYSQQLTSLLQDLYYNQNFLSTPYEQSYDYYKDNFYNKNENKVKEFYFSKNLILSATVLKFPVLLNSWLFTEKFYLLVIKKSDHLSIKKIQQYLKNLNNLNTAVKINLYKKYFDQFSYINKLYNKLLLWLTTLLLKNFNLTTTNIFFFEKFISTILGNKLKETHYIFILLYFFKFFNNYSNIKNKFNSNLFFKNSILKFLKLSTNSETIFKINNFSIKPYFTQSIKSVKRNPITFFRIIGNKKTKSTGSITAWFFNFNVFLPATYFILTTARNNSVFLSYDKKQLSTFVLNSKLKLNLFKYYELKLNLENFLNDNLFHYSNLYLDFKSKTSLLNSLFLNKIKHFLISLFPKNLLNKQNYLYWYNHINIFENLSENTLTSKMWWNTKYKNYFSASINILLILNNKKLLQKISLKKNNYLKILNSLITLEAQALLFHDLIIPFQIDFKKFNLGRKHRLLWVFYKENFFFFIKNFFIKYFYEKPNYMELQLITNLIVSNFFNINRFINLKKFSFSSLTKTFTKTNFFPDFFFDEKLYKTYNYRWFFFGFSKKLTINFQLINSHNKILISFFHIGRLLSNNNLSIQLNELENTYNYFNFFENYFFENYFSKIFLFQNDFNTDNLIKKKFLFLNLSSWFFTTWVNNQINFLIKNFSSSNFYYNLSPFTKILPFHLQLKKKTLKKKFFFFNFLNNLIETKIKKIYYIQKNLNINYLNFFNNICLKNLLNIQFFFFNFKNFKIKNFYLNKNDFLYYITILKSKMILFLITLNCLLKNTNFYFFSKLLKLLLNFWIFILTTLFSSTNKKKIIIFFIKFFFLFQKIYKFKTIGSKELENFFTFSILLKNNNKMTHQTLLSSKISELEINNGLVQITWFKLHKNFFLKIQKNLNYNLNFFEKTLFFSNFLISNLKKNLKNFIILNFSRLNLNLFFSYNFLVKSFTLLQLFNWNFFFSKKKNFFFQSSKYMLLNFFSSFFGSSKIENCLQKTIKLNLYYSLWNNLQPNNLFWNNFFNNSFLLKNKFFNKKLNKKNVLNKKKFFLFKTLNVNSDPILYFWNVFILWKLMKLQLKTKTFWGLKNFKKLIKIYTKWKTKIILNETSNLKMLNFKDQWNLRRNVGIKLYHNKKINKSILSLFDNKKIKQTINNFFMHFLKKININFKFKILKIEIFFLQFFFQSVLPIKKNWLDNNFKIKIIVRELILKDLIKLFFLFKKNNIFFKYSLKYLFNNLNYLKNILNKNKKNFLLSFPFLKNKKIKIKKLNYVKLIKYTQRLLFLTNLYLFLPQKNIYFKHLFFVLVSTLKKFIFTFFKKCKNKFYLKILLDFFSHSKNFLSKILNLKKISFKLKFKTCFIQNNFKNLIPKKSNKTKILLDFFLYDCLILLNLDVSYKFKNLILTKFFLNDIFFKIKNNFKKISKIQFNLQFFLTNNYFNQKFYFYNKMFLLGLYYFLFVIKFLV